jgi:hypothetical protein
MRVRAVHPPGVTWEERSVGDQLGAFDIQQVEGPLSPAPAPGEPAGAAARETTWVFRLAAFDLGELEIPPVTLRYLQPGGGEARAVQTPARTIRVEATVEGAEEDPADVRSGFLPPPPGRIGLYLALAAAALAGAGAFWLWRRRRPKPRAAPAGGPARPRVPTRPAHDRWLEALEALVAERLLEEGRAREFHIRLAEIVKRYLGEVFAFDAMDRTSQEVLEDLASRARPTLRAEAAALLEQCDLVKFAEHQPSLDRGREAARRARVILDLGRPAPALPAAARAEEPAS